jgi:hypothetical protein
VPIAPVLDDIVGTTQIYAKKNLETARAVMRQIG